MKKIYILIAIAVLSVTFGCNLNADKQSISVNIDEEGYAFNAEYPKHKTNQVVNFIENSLKQNDFFSNAEGIKDENVKLPDSSKFYIKAEPGFIKINFDKRNNSETSYQKLVKLCMGIKEELK